ncbi:iron-containing redox enzyme family protein [Hyphomonas sp.]|uniref:TenA family transcriptional regulator n=1 Tax=Hyphomonas sp. TaxID=87 RepID=UPI0025C4D153|nr:iron-containing redox enzyme family protein [Hyphomonas sp.]
MPNDMSPGLTTTTFFERLVRDTADEQKLLLSVPQIRDGLRGQISRRTYIAYLTQAYHHVKHTVPLMRWTKAWLPASAIKFQDALDEYISEESGHEEWILNDIRAAGGDADAVRISEPLPATEFMVSYAYDYISRINPLGFFGMVFVLEGTSTKLACQGADAVMTSLDLPRSAFTYLFSHGALDLEHMNFLATLMGQVKSSEDQDAIIYMAKRMFVLFANVFASIPHDTELMHES